MNDATQKTAGGAKAKKKIGMWVAIGLGVVVLVVAGLMWFGSRPNVIVELMVDEYNSDRGQFVDEVTRFDGAEASGSTVVVRFTIFDRALDDVSPEIRNLLPDQPVLGDFVAIISEALLGQACNAREEYAPMTSEVVVVFEYRDQRGDLLLQAEATESTC